MTLPPSLKRLTVLLTMSGFLCCAAIDCRGEEAVGYLTESRLDKMVAALNKSQSRMQTLSSMIQMCSQVIYPSSSNMMIYPDDKTRKLYERAAAVIRGCATKPTLKLALQSDDHNLQYWALRQIGPRDRDLIPLVQNLTAPGKSHCANEALETLRRLKVAETNIEKQVAISKDTDVLLHQIHDDKEFNRRLLALLNDSSAVVQQSALDFIGYNSGMAEMYHKKFDAAIFDRTLVLSRAPSATLRQSAVFALLALRKYGDDKVKSRLSELLQDQAPEVRSRAEQAMKASAAEQPAKGP
ncbi:MAG: hypothetical protein JSS83_21550 [Cyanobacteria bacterium SZAS LIN-3]|nr:hypothetical protein [Cyanobacteria bacterium SZAS LIN-3]